MASSLSVLEPDLSCPVCFEIYKDPVLLSCTHSFCNDCLQSSCTGERGKCPLCRQTSSHDPVPDRALKNACEAYVRRQMETEYTPRHTLCSTHSNKLHLFCVDDKTLVCSECVSQNHQNHSFCSISKAAAPHKENLRTHLLSLQSKLVAFSKVTSTSDKMAAHIKFQAQQTEKQIKAEFEKLHKFLREQEESRIAALRREEQEKSQKMKEQNEELNKQMKDIKSRIQEVEDKLKSDVLLLQDLKETIRRAQYTVPDPELPHGALINVAEHVGNLRYRVWEKMKDICPYFPVVMNPNTAGSSLVISEDLSSMFCSDVKSELPENPERKAEFSGVLGSEALSSDTHSWEVDVGENEGWTVAVIDISLIGKNTVKGVPGICIGRSDGVFIAGNTKNIVDLKIKTTIKKISVTLNWKKGRVTFTDSCTNDLLYTLKHKLSDRMFPVFRNNSKIPLKILPAHI